MATILDHMLARSDKGGRETLPKVDIGAANILTDPERPSFASDREVGRSQFLYLRRALDEKPPGQNDVWQALKEVAGRVRVQQSPDASRPYVADIPDSAVNQTPLLLDIAVKTRALRDAVARDNPAGVDSIVKAATGAAAEEGYGGKPPSPTEQAKIPGFRQAWESAPGIALRGAYRVLGESAQGYARRENEAANEHNRTLPIADREALVDPKATYRSWVAAVPNPVQPRRDRWTDAFVIGTDNAITSKAIEGFVGIALKAQDRGRDPTAAELKRDVAALDETFRKPEKIAIPTESISMVRAVRSNSGRNRDTPVSDWKTEEGRTQRLLAEVFKGSPKTVTAILENFDTLGQAVKVGDLGNTGKPAREALARQGYDIATIGAARNLARVGRSEEFPPAVARALIPPEPTTQAFVRRGIQEIVVRPPVTGENQYTAHLVGIEGQAYYNNKTAIARELKNAGPAPDGRAKTFVSFAEPGTEFSKTLVAAAGEAGIPVVRGTLNVANRTLIAASSREMQHVDYAFAGGGYSAEPLRASTTNRTFVVEESRIRRPGAQAENGSRPPSVPFDSFEGTRATRGALVLVDVKTPKDTTDFIARLNNAALTSPDMVLFGGPERNDKSIFKIARRRELSELSQPKVIDKNGQQLPPANVALYTTNRGASVNDTRSAQNDTALGWKTDEPRTQTLLTRLLEKEPMKVGTVLDTFKTLGEAVGIADRARQGGAEARTSLAGQGYNQDAINAAASVRRAVANGPAFNEAVLEAQTRTESQRDYANRQGVDLLVDPRDPAVRKTGPMVGFSTPAARNAPVGSRYAVVGDDGPATPETRRQVETLIEGLAKLHGRDENGVARMRIATTLTPGVGEAVMRASIDNKVPVEAYGSKDDRNFAAGSKDLELFSLAARANKEGLGGTWSLAAYGGKGEVPQASREKAARAAIESSDALVVGYLNRTDPLLMVAAAAGRGKPIATLPSSGPESNDSSGTAELVKPHNSIVAIVPAGERYDPSFVAAGARLSPISSEGYTQARADTGPGAMQLVTTRDLRTLKDAAAGLVDLTLSRPDPTASRTKPAPEATPPRADVLERAEVDRLIDPTYRRSLGMLPQEAKIGREAVAERGFERGATQAPVTLPANEMAARLREKFTVIERGRKDRPVTGPGMEP